MRWWWLAILIGACSRTPTEVVRSATYGPSFGYLSRAEIKTEMHQFAGGIAELNRLLEQGGEAVDRTEVLRVLDEIDDAAGQLERSGATSGHVEIDKEISRFRRDVAAARAAADREKPSYFLATTVVSSCVYCHQP